MIIKVDPAALKQTKWHEYLVRFVLGGLITASAGMIARKCGPVTGGLFLAFPAIFPASATLIEKHERQRKEQRGLHGEKRGRDAAAVDAAGAALGSIGLMVFATTAWALLPSFRPILAITIAAIAWLLAAGLAWVVWKKRHWRVRD